jgi:hypothetical protein
MRAYAIRPYEYDPTFGGLRVKPAKTDATPKGFGDSPFIFSHAEKKQAPDGRLFPNIYV